MTESPFEVRIICDMRAHPHHKGRDQHITALENDPSNQFNPWSLSRREREKQARHNDRISDIGDGSGTERRAPFQRIVISEAHQWGRDRFEFYCPRCGYKVAGANATLTHFFDLARAKGKPQVALTEISAFLEMVEERRALPETYADGVHRLYELRDALTLTRD